MSRIGNRHLVIPEGVTVTVNGNNIKVSITYKSTCGGCAQENVYYLLKVNKN